MSGRKSFFSKENFLHWEKWLNFDGNPKWKSQLFFNRHKIPLKLLELHSNVRQRTVSMRDQVSSSQILSLSKSYTAHISSTTNSKANWHNNKGFTSLLELANYPTTTQILYYFSWNCGLPPTKLLIFSRIIM